MGSICFRRPDGGRGVVGVGGCFSWERSWRWAVEMGGGSGIENKIKGERKSYVIIIIIIKYQYCGHLHRHYDLQCSLHCYHAPRPSASPLLCSSLAA